LRLENPSRRAGVGRGLGGGNAGVLTRLVLFAALVLPFALGCQGPGDEGDKTPAKTPPSKSASVPGAAKAEPSGPRVGDYGLPLDIHIDVPEVPKEIVGPTPMPQKSKTPRAKRDAEKHDAEQADHPTPPAEEPPKPPSGAPDERAEGR
jgi:hypothetical protein